MDDLNQPDPLEEPSRRLSAKANRATSESSGAPLTEVEVEAAEAEAEAWARQVNSC